MIECKDCRFFVPIQYTPTEGVCHRLPWQFRMGIHDWCGEAKRRDDVDWHQVAKDEYEFYEAFGRDDDTDHLRSRS